MTPRETIIAIDREFVWRPYTSHVDHQQKDPLVIERASGVYLYDVDGRRYIDANGSWWVCNLGHGHPRLVRALREQSEKLAHCSMAGVTHETAALLARDLVAAAPPGMARAFFSDDGSTAVEVAVKIAYQFWQQNGHKEKNRFISLAGAYHGDTLGAVSLGGVDVFRARYGGLLFDAIHTSHDDTEHFDRVVEQVATLLQAHNDVCALVVEPLVQGAAGMLIWAPEHLRALRDLTQKHNVLLIADEVFTGYGRTGKMWACDYANITPDLLCTAKGFSGGVLPMAATLATQNVYDGFSGGLDRTLMHGHSFYGNPLGAAIAREVLAIYREENIIAHGQALGSQIAQAFAELRALPNVVRTRSLGMIGAADLGGDGYRGARGWAVYEAARRLGAYLRPLGDTVYIAPPLTITQAELAELLHIVRESIREVA